jgi:hypothetical protein
VYQYWPEEAPVEGDELLVSLLQEEKDEQLIKRKFNLQQKSVSATLKYSLLISYRRNNPEK